jgi:hypothetical protein
MRRPAMKLFSRLCRARAHEWALALALLCAGLACVLPSGSPGPVQSWWHKRGPVVPHDGFPGDCSLCHEGAGWSTIRADFQYDHAVHTGVELVGAHRAAQCLRCHNDRGPVQLFAQRGCAGCHEDVHRGQLGAGCETCHSQSNWRPDEQIAQHMRWGFPLIGAHAATACWRCHPNAQAGNFTRTTSTCAECHRDDLQSAVDPDHQAQGWVANCQECHIPTTWTGAGFNHPWPLTGAHQDAACNDCHAGGVFAGTPDQCVDCHLDDYSAAQDPNHVALGISTNCAQCHDTSTWEGASFDHAGITSGCVQCHLDDYQAAQDPNHSAAGFPTTCEDCHGTSTWSDAEFDHAFPIQAGPHGGLACGDCHLQPSSFRNFSCTHCHEHSQREMDDEHDRVPGYSWNSAACYQCHPQGQE